MSRWSFVKMHGLGNDFVVVDERSGGVFPVAAVPRICDRQRGVGADGVLVLSAASTSGARARMTVWNADGSGAEMCGNGIRCVARLLTEAGAVAVETGAGVLTCRVFAGGEVEVEMGTGTVDGKADAELEAGGRRLSATRVRTGNPHLVTFDPVGEQERARIASEFERLLPGGTNVEFAQMAGEGIELVVWERGVGFTRACGTGACATVVAACATGRAPFDAAVRVTLPGGVLSIVVPSGGAPIRMRGPAESVFEGQLELP